MKKMLLFICLAAFALIAGCLEKPMALNEAELIAKTSSCMAVGNLTNTSYFNNETQTWWIDLDTVKPGCAPACVIYLTNKTAEVNWRCTGLLPQNLTEEEAREIASASDCMKEGGLKNNSFYNENSRTWWFDMDVAKPGCNPACVVFEENRTTEINWRCTGLLPPENETIGGQRDEHGCLIPAGYTWCVPKEKCLREWEEPCVVSLNITEAEAIARSSECMAAGNLTTESSYNEITKTWWIDLDTVKPGCSPACVVHESNRTAEVNWRCTGLLPINVTECYKPCHIYIGMDYTANPPICFADVLACTMEYRAGDACLKYVDCNPKDRGCETTIDQKFSECISCFEDAVDGKKNQDECENAYQ